MSPQDVATAAGHRASGTMTNTVWSGVVSRFRRSLARLYNERDFFRPYEILLALPGFHLMDNFQKSGWKRALFIASRAVLLLQYAIWLVRFYMAMCEAPGHEGKALHYGNTVGVLTMMLARMLVVRWYLPNVQCLMRYLRRQRSRQGRTGDGTYRKILNIALTFQAIGLADRVVFCFSRTYREELYKLPVNSMELGWPMVVALHVLSFDFASRWAAAYNVSLTGMNSIMMGLYDELADIAAEYGQLFNGRSDGGGFWDCLDRNVVRTVQRHETFLAQLAQLKPFLRTTFLMMFYSASLFIALGTFMITANGTSTYDVILSGFLSALLLECYWCCQLVDRLNELNAHIGKLLYNMEWPMELRYTEEDAALYRQARSSLLIMMSKTQQRLGISCGGIFEMSREAFANLMKITYTMLMFLRDTQNFV
uniref:Odorant receptor n=1 Tax=Anopheles farauti TaxID=69004 RepID=A0A182QUB4_9DIPT